MKNINKNLIKNILTKAKIWILRFTQIQLVMSLVSLIILVNWGLPTSLLAPFGNMLFSPIFTVFLGLCSIIFFLEILYIPNTFFIYLLEKTNSLWLFLAQDFGNKSLIAFAKPPLWFTFLIPILIIFILINKKINSLSKSIISLSLLFFISCAYLKIAYIDKSFTKKIPCNGGQITFIYDKGKTKIIDPGLIGKRISAESFVQYTLVPEIIKSCGAMHIDQIETSKSGKLTIDAIIQLCNTFIVKNICMPEIKPEKMKRGLKRSFEQLNKLAKERNITIKSST